MERAIEDIDESIELHRPYVDDVHLECPKVWRYHDQGEGCNRLLV